MSSPFALPVFNFDLLLLKRDIAPSEILDLAHPHSGVDGEGDYGQILI